MRFHVVSLPHTHTTSEFPACAFTNKVVRFCRMMMRRGHEVFLYSGDENDAPCAEHISCVSDGLRKSIMGADQHYTSPTWGGPLWDAFNANAINAIRQRARMTDFLCVIGGTAHKPIAEALPSLACVEFGIGYSGTFAPFRVFESYAWMHTIYGAASGGNASAVDGKWWDAVIPNQVDETAIREAGEHGDYYLYVGRLIDRKGYSIAQDVCRKLGKRLILAGPGEHVGYGEFVGEVDANKRNELMREAIALFAPTIYIEPFGTVTIEAMANGCPVICTDWGAFTETVREGDGWRCRTFEDFVNAANVAWQDAPDNRASRQKRALSRFSMANVGKQYEDYFSKLTYLWSKDKWYNLNGPV